MPKHKKDSSFACCIRREFQYKTIEIKCMWCVLVCVCVCEANEKTKQKRKDAPKQKKFEYYTE